MAVVEYDTRDGVAYITLNRPEKLNAINLEMRDELFRVFRDFQANPDAWVAVVTGAGNAFCVGHDLQEMGGITAGETPGASIEDLYVLQAQIWKPILAAVNGYCLAQGGGIALACDIRIASDRAQFGWPQAKRGISSISGPAMLASRIPVNYALEFLFIGDFIDAQEAHRLHLVNKVVPHEELMSTVDGYVQKILQNAPLAISAIKEAAVKGQTMRLDERVELGGVMFKRVQQTADAKEGLRAFAEKRTPVFKGH